MTITVIIGYSPQFLPIYIIASVAVKKRRDFYFVIVGRKLRIHQYEWNTFSAEVLQVRSGLTFFLNTE